MRWDNIGGQFLFYNKGLQISLKSVERKKEKEIFQDFFYGKENFLASVVSNP